MNKQQKAAQYDAMEADRNKLSLAVHDLANRRFSFPVVITAQWIRENLSSDYDGGRYKISMSWRAMPLFLVVYQSPGQDDQTLILTEDEIQTEYRDRRFWYSEVLMHARNALVDKQLAKERTAA